MFKYLIILLSLILLILGCTQQIKIKAPITAVYIDFIPCFNGMGLREFTSKTKRTPEIVKKVQDCQFMAIYNVVDKYRNSDDYHVYIRVEMNYMEYAGTINEVMDHRSTFYLDY